MPIVYDYEIYSELHQSHVVQPYKRTAEIITLEGGRIIPGTGEDVPEEALDGMGRYIVKPEQEESSSI